MKKLSTGKEIVKGIIVSSIVTSFLFMTGFIVPVLIFKKLQHKTFKAHCERFCKK